MTWPASDVNTTNADASTDSPATFRTDVLDLLTKFNLLRNHVTTLGQTVLSRGTAESIRADIAAAPIEPGTSYPIGCVVFANFNNASGGNANINLAYGATTGGISLLATGVALQGTAAYFDFVSGQGTLPGTWRCLGTVNYVNGSHSPSTLWQRIV